MPFFEKGKKMEREKGRAVSKHASKMQGNLNESYNFR